jgi:hypothetical protein
MRKIGFENNVPVPLLKPGVQAASRRDGRHKIEASFGMALQRPLRARVETTILGKVSLFQFDGDDGRVSHLRSKSESLPLPPETVRDFVAEASISKAPWSITSGSGHRARLLGPDSVEGFPHGRSR